MSRLWPRAAAPTPVAPGPGSPEGLEDFQKWIDKRRVRPQVLDVNGLSRVAPQLPHGKKEILGERVQRVQRVELPSVVFWRATESVALPPVAWRCIYCNKRLPLSGSSLAVTPGSGHRAHLKNSKRCLRRQPSGLDHECNVVLNNAFVPFEDRTSCNYRLRQLITDHNEALLDVRKCFIKWQSDLDNASIEAWATKITKAISNGDDIRMLADTFDVLMEGLSRQRFLQSSWPDSRRQCVDIRTPSTCQNDSDSDGSEHHVPSASLNLAEALVYVRAPPLKQRESKGLRNLPFLAPPRPLNPLSSQLEVKNKDSNEHTAKHSTTLAIVR